MDARTSTSEAGVATGAAAASRSRWVRWTWRIVRLPLVAYVGVCLVLWLLENAMVFHPSRADDWELPPNPDIEDVYFKSADGNTIHAWWCPLAARKHGFTLLYCHGNAGNLSHRGGSIAKLRDLLDVNVLIFDYPGYGKSTGRPSEKGCYDAAEAAYLWLIREKQVAPEDLVHYGGSLGGGVAVEMATRHRGRGLILINTFASAPAVGQGMFPWLPVRWLMRNRFDNLAKIASVGVPVYIAHATHDRTVPFDHGKLLFETASAPKRFLVIEGADHNDKLPDEFFREVREFLETPEENHPGRATP